MYAANTTHDEIKIKYSIQPGVVFFVIRPDEYSISSIRSGVFFLRPGGYPMRAGGKGPPTQPRKTKQASKGALESKEFSL